MKKQWLDDNNKLFSLPIIVNSDNDYLKDLDERFDKILSAFSNENEVNDLKEITDAIISSIRCYYKGEFEQSFSLTHSLFNKLRKDTNSKCCFAPLSESYIPKDSTDNAQFFRARLVESYGTYKSNEMLHVPLNQRGKCSAGRFSIPGIPCLYLGNTSYVCWLEMNCPSDNTFCVSPFSLDNDLFLFNIAWPIDLIYEATKKENRDDLIYFLKIYLLEMATSYIVKEKNRSFQSEYIVSQNIMRACIKERINGIIYFSKKVSDNCFALAAGINVVIFLDYDCLSSEISPICQNKMINGDAFNFAMYKNLQYSQKYRTPEMAVDNSGYIANIGNFSYQYPYKETEFHSFDQFLFGHIMEAKKRQNLVE